MKRIALLCKVGLLSLCFRMCSFSACSSLEFAFPLLENKTFSVQEHVNETLSFGVTGKDCSDFSFSVIQVDRQDSRRTLCMIFQDNLQDKNCTCENLTDEVLPLSCNITSDFDREDKQLMFERIPQTSQSHTKNRVTINVKYPTTLSDFQITPSQELKENETVQMNCSRINGNPQKRILIRNPKNQTIVSQNPNNQLLNATIFEGNMTCSDSGQYRCEAEGTDQYKAVDLMVKCPPRIMNDTEEKTVVLGSSAVFQFDVFSYKNFIVCTLEGPRINGPINCSSDKTETTISGTPPHLRLEIKVKNAGEDDEGTWRLTVDNGFTDNAGVPVHATVSFTLHVYSLAVTTEMTHTVPTKSPPISPGMSAMIGVVGFLTLVIVVLVLSVVYFRKKSQRKGAINSTRNSDSQGDPDRVSGHSYEEILDAAAPRPPRSHHHEHGQTSRPGRSPAAPTRPAVDSQPDDYLHPVNSQTASSGTNQPHDAPAATPGGPYDSLEMSDVGLRSPYSQLGM